MKICYILKDLSSSGAPKVVLDEARILSELGHEVCFYPKVVEGGLVDEFKSTGCVKKLSAMRFFDLRSFDACSFHSFFGMLIGFLYSFYPGVANSKNVLTVHGLQGEAISLKLRSILDFFLRFIVGRFDHVVVMNDSDKRRLSLGRRCGDSWSFLKNSFDEQPYDLNSSEEKDKNLVVGYYGRLDDQKNIPFLLECFDSLPSGTQVFVAGYGKYEMVCQEYAVNQERFTFFGEYCKKDIPTFPIDIYVSASRYEGLPLGVIEAASSGASLILSDIPGHEIFSSAKKFTTVTGFIKAIEEVKAEHDPDKNILNFKSLKFPSSKERANSMLNIYQS